MNRLIIACLGLLLMGWPSMSSMAQTLSISVNGIALPVLTKEHGPIRDERVLPATTPRYERCQDGMPSYRPETLA